VTITLAWWLVPLVLFLLPFGYLALRERETGWLPNLLDPIIFIVCWAAALAFLGGHFLR